MRNIKIDSEKKYSVIRPELHSQFIEFLGGCIYDGIWVGEDSEIPNVEGIRKDFVEAMKHLQPPLVRWPGGCYADTYHWRDGIGERDARPVTFNENFATYELDNNHFGTHEFIRLCQLIGAKPWININMLTGSVREAKEWMEYCNREDETALKAERTANGSAEAFHVEHWGIGNEPWGGGGCYTAENYANEYRKYVTAAPTFQKDVMKPSPQPMRMIIAGPDGNKPKERVAWTKDLFAALGKYRFPRVDGMDLHFYNWNVTNPQDTDVTFDKDGWYRVIDSCLELDEVIREQYDLVQEGLAALPEPEGFFDAGEKTCDLYVGEWGNWHASAFTARPALFQQVTMRDAITSALTLDIFHKNSDKVRGAFVAQTVNVLNSLFLTDHEKFLKTPNYDVFDMYMVHRGATRIEAQVDAAAGSAAAASSDTAAQSGSMLETLYAMASEKDGVISINLVNTGYDEAETVSISLPAGCTYVSGQVLCSEHPDDCNTWDDPDHIRAKACDAPEYDAAADAWIVKLPAASVTVVRFAECK